MKGQAMVWNHIKWFNRWENWGDPSKIDPLLIVLLDEIRDIYGKPFIIHCAYETSGHAPNSYHYLGRAVDFHIKDDKSFSHQVNEMLQILDIISLKVENYSLHKPYRFLYPIADYVGLGIYPNWEHPGFHLDTRGYRARWARIGDKYVSFEQGLEYIKKKEKGEL